MPVSPNKRYVIYSATARQIVLWVLDQALMSTRLGDLNDVISGQAVDQALRDAADFVLKHATAAEMEDLVAMYSEAVGGAIDILVYDGEKEDYDDAVNALEDGTANLIQRAFSEGRAEKLDKLSAELAQESLAQKLIDQATGS